MIDVKTLRSQNMFSKSDSSCSAWNKDQRKLQDEIILLDENRHNESFQNLFPVFASTQNNRQESPSQQHFLNNQKDNEKKPFYSSKVMASTDDMMAPQSICFIGDEEDVVEFEKEIEKTCKNDDSEVGGTKFNITSGNLTYRIASPSRPLINSSSFQNQEKIYSNEEVFSFNDEQPKWLKPPLRIKGSKNEKNLDNVDHQIFVKIEPFIQHSKFDDNGATQNNLNTNNFVNNATYNKYTDAPIQLKQFTESNNHNSLMNNTISSDRRHLEDLTNQQQAISPTLGFATSQHNNGSKGEALVIGTDASNLDSESIDEMERRKEKIMLLSLQRRQKQEESKAGKHFEENRRREREREKEEERARKKDEQKIKRAAILEHHRLKNAIVGAEREGNTLDRYELMIRPQPQSAIAPRLRNQKVIQSRPKTIHVDISETIISSRGKKGSTPNLTGYGLLSLNSKRQDFHKGSQDSLCAKKFPDDYPSTKNVSPIGQRGLYSTSRESTVERGRTLSRISAAKGNNLNFRGRKSNSLINLRDPGLGSATPPRRTESPGMSLSGRHKSSPSGPGSLPTALISKGRGFDSGSNIITYTPNSFMEYSGPKLYKQPTAKSNRGIILNAVEYCVFPGAVNRDAKQKVLEKIAQSEAKHFLVLFRDAGCQFRALYSYAPESNQVFKMYGTGPSQVDEAMFDKFLKYNSGGKCFSQVYTKHVTVTIDAFTIHNSLWQGKKIHLPTKKNMSLVI